MGSVGAAAEEAKERPQREGAVGGMERRRRARFLCLHGFRTSGEIMRTQVTGKWPGDVTGRLDLVFADAPFPGLGKSEVDGIFPPPYYEWFQFDKEFKEYKNFDACLAYIEELMIEHGPIDGLMGFSQGVALTRVPKVKYVVIIGGAKFQSPAVAEKAYATKIECPSLHFIGDADFLKQHGETLLESFVDPYVIRHPKGHTVPRIDDASMETMLNFLNKIENYLNDFVEDATTFEQEEGA